MLFMEKSCLATLIVGAAAVIVPSSSARAQSWPATRKEIDTSFTIAKGGTVMLGDGNAHLIVTGWDQPTVQVRGRSEDGVIKVEATAMKIVVGPGKPTDEVTIKVMVPRGVRVIARTGSGDITIKETHGDVDVESTAGNVVVTDAADVDVTNLSGDIDVRQSTGSVTLANNSGDCTVSDARGSIEATSVSGDVRISRSSARLVTGETTNGSVSFEGVIVDGGRYAFATHSGGVWLGIPKTASAQFGITTWNGQVESEFPVALRPGFTSAANSTKRYAFTLGQGSARVTVETFSGDVSITSSGGK
jgi:hypothetical protein